MIKLEKITDFANDPAIFALAREYLGSENFTAAYMIERDDDHIGYAVASDNTMWGAFLTHDGVKSRFAKNVDQMILVVDATFANLKPSKA